MLPAVVCRFISIAMFKGIRVGGLKTGSKGFTLVELLVVIAIIGTLATLLLLQLGVARAKARDAKRVSDINQLRSAVELYFDDNNGKYPAGINTAATCIAALGKYLAAPTCPADPVTAASYFYAYAPTTGPVQFHLWSELEGKSQGLNSDSDINSTTWTAAAGDTRDASSAVISEACSAAYAAGGARDCIYDTGQK